MTVLLAVDLTTYIFRKMRKYAHRIAVTVLVAAISLLGTEESLGQQIDRNDLALRSDTAGKSSSSDRIESIHVTDRLISSPEGQEALARFRERQSLNLPPAPGKGAGASVGSIVSFRVYDFETNSYRNVDFTLSVEEERFNIWVETALLASNPDGMITDNDVEMMRKALADSTGPNSYDPSMGIIEVDELVFGNPPNVDGDGRTDVLIHDVKDGYDPASGQFGAILGFFDPQDLNAPNSADIIHLDAMPGMFTIDGARRPFSLVQQTLAHEYEHLIFQQEGGQAPAFVDEGLAEWAEVVNGYVGRTITYNSVQSELRRPLFGFRSFSSGSVGFDYQRAGLFTNYFSERQGILETGSITGVSSSIEQGYYQAILGGDDPAGALRELIHDFHVANAINDRSVAPEYGYARPQFSVVRASGYPEFNGEDSDGTSGAVTIEPGGVAYVAVNEASDFSVSIDAASGQIADRVRIRGTVIARRSNGTTTLHDLVPAGEGVFLGADHSRVIILLTNEAIGTTSSVEIEYQASWAPVEQTVEFQDVAYENGQLITYLNNDGNEVPEGFAFFADADGILGPDDRAANRFQIPDGAVLASVDVALLYSVNFGGENPSSTTRDFRVGIWSSDINGEPDEEIISVDVVDQSADVIGGQYDFQRVDLTPFRSQLLELEGELHVAVGNAGTDDNYVFAPHSTYSGESNPAFVQTTFDTGTAWANFESIQSGGTFFWENLVNTIRARFELNVIVDVEDEATLPQTVTLEQNYPNPFNPATTIRFSLPESRQVHLRVFDMLGREITTLADGVLPAGQHEVEFDAGSLSSGLYLYRLDADGISQTRTMMLVK